MNPRLYTIKSSVTEDDYLYEIVESGGQTGVRCRIYVSAVELFKDCFDLYTPKQAHNIQTIVESRYKIASQKFECIVWCWPYDTFSFKIGKEMAKERVDEKIKLKKKHIKSFIRHIEKHNLPKSVLKRIEDEWKSMLFFLLF